MLVRTRTPDPIPHHSLKELVAMFRGR